jgi:hypothetical protein
VLELIYYNFAKNPSIFMIDGSINNLENGVLATASWPRDKEKPVLGPKPAEQGCYHQKVAI